MRQKHYRDRFRTRLSDEELRTIRDATNKSWVLGSDGFKKKVAGIVKRQVQPKRRGGDHKSDAYKMRDKVDMI